MTQFMNISDDKAEILDQENVIDEAPEQDFSSERFTITSYGADYPVDALVKRMKSGAYFIPPFQRLFIWNTKQASRFIESLLLGLPVPGIFVFKEDDSGRHLVIDGQQRLRSLQYFYQGTFRDRTFKLLDVREPWNGKTYEQLDQDDKQRLDDSIVHTTVFRQDSPQENDQSVYEVFERINSGGVKLSAQEIRACVNFGTATDLLKNMNEDTTWRQIYGAKSPRLKDHELILRFLAMTSNQEKYKKPMSIFLNKHMQSLRQLYEVQTEELINLWAETMRICHTHIGAKVFRPERPLNASVFDSVACGVARRIKLGPIRNPEDVGKIYETLLTNKDFVDAYEAGTSDEERVKTRMNLSISSFSELK